MSVKHGLLTLLSQTPAYGYQLKTDFETRTANAWPLNIGQVYTTLDRLVRDGLAEPTDGPEDDGHARYAITDAGRRELTAWFDTPVEVTTPPRSDLAIKLALAVTLPGVDVPTIIQRQRSATLRTLQHYTLAKRQADPDDLPWLMVIERMIFSAEAEARWLDHCERLALRAQPAGRPSQNADAHTATTKATR